MTDRKREAAGAEAASGRRGRGPGRRADRLTGLPALLWRYRFTLVMLGLLAALGLGTHSVFGLLSRDLTDTFGFAPRDLLAGRLPRLLASALVTPGGRAFWEAVLAVAVVAGWSEHVAGTRLAILAFWGVHVLAVIALSLIAYALAAPGHSLGPDLLSVRTVGASAGYVGSLGLVVSRLPRRWRRRATVVVFAVLLVLLVLPVGQGEARVVWLTDGIAHLLAFSLGLGVGWRGSPAARR